MFWACIFAHIALGCVFSWFFVICYINGDVKGKLYLELLLGLGGNIGGIFILHNRFQIDDIKTSLYSIASCLFAFLLLTFVLILALAYAIKDKENNGKDIIRLRDIILGQTSWVKEYRDGRMKEIDGYLNYEELKRREQDIAHKEEMIKQKLKNLDEEQEKLRELAKKKVQFLLPENSNVIVSKEIIEVMPSYFMDVVRCINEMGDSEKQYLEMEHMDKHAFVAYLLSLSISIASNIFSINSSDVRIHFRYYDEKRNGYEKLIAINGKKLSGKDMTFIPYKSDNMIVKSYECKRALIKSINCDYDYQSNNYNIWEDYFTYTFHTLLKDDVPVLSFGISIKNATRYKKNFYFLSYICFEDFLQDKIDTMHTKYNLLDVLYGGN